MVSLAIYYTGCLHIEPHWSDFHPAPEFYFESIGTIKDGDFRKQNMVAEKAWEFLIK